MPLKNSVSLIFLEDIKESLNRIEEALKKLS